MPYLNSNDKEPAWDGYICAYNNNGNHSNDEMAGRAFVQIKCTSNEKRKSSYPVEMAHLKSYLQEGGTLFLVVYITDEEEFVYYCSLLPFELKRIIRDHGNQGSYNIQLKPFPKNKKDITDLVLNFIRDQDKQKAAIAADIVTMDELEKTSFLKSVSFGFTTINGNQKRPFEYLFDHDIYIYADLPLGISLPVEHIDHMEMAVAELPYQVYVNEKLFYESYKYVINKENDEFHFGKSLKLLFPKNGEGGGLTFKMNGTLEERIHDGEFFIAALEYGGITINGKDLPLFKMPEEERDRFDIPSRIEYVEYLKKVKAVLSTLHVKKELDLDKMQDQDERNLRRLVSAIYEKNLIQLKDTEAVIGNYRIANLILLMCAIKDEDSGLYRLYDFFDSPLVYKGVDCDGNEFNTSICVQLDAESLLNYDNIDYGTIIEMLNKVPYSEPYGSQVVLLLLEVLKAYDELKLPTHPLLELAEKIQDFIEIKSTEHDRYIVQINKLQIIKRRREFTSEEKEQLFKLTEDVIVKIDNKLMTGIYLLLNDQASAKKYYEKLQEQEKEEFDKYPICRFITWKSS